LELGALVHKIMVHWRTGRYGALVHCISHPALFLNVFDFLHDFFSTGLETIRTGAGKHLVHAENVEGMHADAHVEEILTGVLDHGLVRGNTGSLESLGGDLLVLIGDEMHAQGELIAGILLASYIVDTW
jgi:hypothetical protein